jgi:hypothetical protein
MRDNQYFMYGILIPYNKYKEWEEGTGRKFPIGVYGDIFCLFRSRDEKFLIIGKKVKLNSYNSPIRVPELNEVEQMEVESSVEEKFGFKGDFHYYFITE